MIIIGVTGGIGSGKSTVCKFFENIGISVFNTDYSAKMLISSSTEIRGRLVDCFGEELYMQSGDLNKDFISREIFSNPFRLNQLNELVHPAVLDKFNSWIAKQTSRYVIIESAILLDAGWQKYVDKVITVVCDVEKRVDRVVRRGGMTRELIERILLSQMADEERISMSDFIIDCSDKELIIPQILEIDKKILR